MDDFKIDESHLSIADMYKIGVGPSSSHTVGPMLAGWQFGTNIIKEGLLDQVEQVKINLYGSLALTGKGHVTDVASIVGIAGNRPDEVESSAIPEIMEKIEKTKTLSFMNKKTIPFVEDVHLIWNFETFLPEHPNGIRFVAYNETGEELYGETFFSIGGGFIISENDGDGDNSTQHNINPKYAYHSAEELLDICNKNNITIAQLQKENELAWRSEQETNDFMDKICDVMFNCIETGIKNTGTLPGSLKLERRANKLYNNLIEQQNKPHNSLDQSLNTMDWVNLYALAVNEENAACGQVVTAPTNGAAGVIPAVLKYFKEFCNASPEGLRTFILAAGAIGTLFKKRASISAAAVGCQGEIGVACSMAAAGLTAALGGTNEQVENAAEIAMEHNLGLTCDPIAGLVQIPCIERNTMGAIKAINASRIALQSEGEHFVSLDSVIETMRQTGRDMDNKYKETSMGGLAINTTVC